MDNFYLYTSIIGIGIGIVIVLMVLELSKGKKQPAIKPAKDKTSAPTDILNKLGLNQEQSALSLSQSQSKESLLKNNPNPKAIPSKESSDISSAVKIEPVLMNQPPTESDEYLELKQKYEKLETLFKEKGNELEKKEVALANELKIRKDFNKLKDILEKELKDTKDKCHKMTLELAVAKPEIENQKTRINQLQDMVNKKNKDIWEREQKISELTKQLTNLTGKTVPLAPSKEALDRTADTTAPEVKESLTSVEPPLKGPVPSAAQEIPIVLPQPDPTSPNTDEKPT